MHFGPLKVKLKLLFSFETYVQVIKNYDRKLTKRQDSKRTS